ncbi:MAG: serine protease Do [Acidobacteriota bacterium]|nr:serine protease Do [Acidobacteriota bacterium]
MKTNARAILMCATLFASCVFVANVRAEPTQLSMRRQQFGDGVLDSVVTILVESEGESHPVGSGLVARADGLILTANHLVKDARNVQVRLRNGETFDRAVLVATDERRDVAILRIPAAGLSTFDGFALEEAIVGTPVAVVTYATSETGEAASGLLSSVSLADEGPGAGRGFRVLRFTAPVPQGAAGGVLVDEKGRAIGLVTMQAQAQGASYAVPLSGLIGLVRSIGVQVAPVSTQVAMSNAPYPIPQGQVSVPQRPTLPLEARGPGSVVVGPSRPVDVLLASRTIYVRSYTSLFKPEQLVNELNKRAEINAWNLSFVDDERVADLVLTIDHVVFTYKYTFTLSHQRTGIIVASGSRVIWDGNLGAPDMAERVVEKLKDVRAQTPSKPETATEKVKK